MSRPFHAAHLLREDLIRNDASRTPWTKKLQWIYIMGVYNSQGHT